MRLYNFYKLYGNTWRSNHAVIQKLNANEWIFHNNLFHNNKISSPDAEIACSKVPYAWLDCIHIFPRVLPTLRVSPVNSLWVLITRLGRHIRTRITGGCRPTGLEAPITTYRVQCSNPKWWRPSAVQFHSVAGSRSKLLRAPGNFRGSFGNQKLSASNHVRGISGRSPWSKIRTGTRLTIA